MSIARKCAFVMVFVLLANSVPAESRFLLQFDVGPVKGSRIHSEYLGTVDYFKAGWQTGIGLRMDFLVFSFLVSGRRIQSKYRYQVNATSRLYQTNTVSDIPITLQAALRPLGFLDSWPLQPFIGVGYDFHSTTYDFINMDHWDYFEFDQPAEKTIKTNTKGMHITYGLELRSSPKTLLMVSVVHGSMGEGTEEDPEDYEYPKRTKEEVLIEDWLWPGNKGEDLTLLDELKIDMVMISLSVAFR